MSMALIKSSVAAAMKIRPPAVTTGPPLFGVPISSGRKVGMPNGPLRRAEPKGRSHTVVPWILDVMAPELRRRVRAVITSALEVDAADHLIDRGDAPHVAFDQVGLAQRVVAREGLRLGALVRLGAALRDRNLVDLMQRLSGGPVEHEDVAVLAGQQDRRHLAA